MEVAGGGTMMPMLTARRRRRDRCPALRDNAILTCIREMR